MAANLWLFDLSGVLGIEFFDLAEPLSDSSGVGGIGRFFEVGFQLLDRLIVSLTANMQVKDVQAYISQAIAAQLTRFKQ
jgi:hypothetical protein